jgi:hypothetical protein
MFSCTESKVGPNLDWVGAGLQVAGMVIASGDDTTEYSGGWYALNIGITGLLVAGGVRGGQKVDECRAAKAALMQRLTNDEEASTRIPFAPIAPEWKVTGPHR